MAALQIKNFPPELLQQLKLIALSEEQTLTDLVTKALKNTADKYFSTDFLKSRKRGKQ
jgi:hypothetical protein